MSKVKLQDCWRETVMCGGTTQVGVVMKVQMGVGDDSGGCG